MFHCGNNALHRDRHNQKSMHWDNTHGEWGQPASCSHIWTNTTHYFRGFSLEGTCLIIAQVIAHFDLYDNLLKPDHLAQPEDCTASQEQCHCYNTAVKNEEVFHCSVIMSSSGTFPATLCFVVWHTKRMMKHIDSLLNTWIHLLLNNLVGWTHWNFVELHAVDNYTS